MKSARSPLQVLIERVVTEKANLSRADTVFAFECMFNGSESDTAIGSFLTALAMKGESDDEILGTYEAVRKKENMFGPALGPSIDICGTGGEALKTFNISTAPPLSQRLLVAELQNTETVPCLVLVEVQISLRL